MNPTQIKDSGDHQEVIRTRFAPSPTGLLHLGHAYAAGYAYALAASHNGECLLRFEDIDRNRVREPYYEQILNDLSFLGLNYPASPLCQKDRLDAYQAALQVLIEKDFVYPCFCSRKDIERELANLPHAPHGPEGPLYPGTCRHLSEQEIAEQLASGKTPSWRLNSKRLAAHYPGLYFLDSFVGKVDVSPDVLGDVILARKDIGTSYHIAVVVDDAFQKITDVSRGEDLLPATHVHRLLQQALELPVPRYHHHRIITDQKGTRLAKRDDALSIRSLAGEGESPALVWNRVFPEEHSRRRDDLVYSFVNQL